MCAIINVEVINMAMKEKTKRIDLITDDLGDINFGNVTISIENFKEKLNQTEEKGTDSKEEKETEDK